MDPKTLAARMRIALAVLAMGCTSGAGANLFAELLPRLHGPITAEPSAPGGQAKLSQTPKLFPPGLKSVDLATALQWHGQPLGQARAFGSVSPPGTATHTVSSGLAWAIGSPAAAGLDLGVLHTGLEGPTADGGELLAVASATLRLGEAWFAPTLTMEYATVEGDAGTPAEVEGSATRLSVEGKALGATYGLRLTEAEVGFRPLGAGPTAGRSAAEFTTAVALPAGAALGNSLRVIRLASTAASRWQHATTLSFPSPFRGFKSLRLQASFGQRTLSSASEVSTWRLRVGTGGFAWRDWRLGGALTLGQRRVDGLRADRRGWFFSGKRWITLGGLRGSLRSSVKLSRIESAWRVRSGIDLALGRRNRRLSMHIDYVAGAWTSRLRGHNSMHFTLRYQVNPSAILPGFASAFGQLTRLSPGW